MRLAIHGLTGKLRGTANQTRGNVTQRSKRAMLRCGIVPPPFRISIDVTDRCNLQCPTCSKWRQPPSREELDLEQWKLVLDRLRGVSLLGEISIGGGEPFMRTDLFQIIESAKERGFRADLISNGWLVDESVLKELEGIGLDTMMISLNSLSPSIHDASRDRQGCHERIMELIEAWRTGERRTRLCLSTVVLETNCAELTSLARFVGDEGLTGIMFQVLLPTEVHYCFAAESSMPQSSASWYEHDPLWVRSLDTLRRQVEGLLDLQAKGYPILNPPPQLARFTTYYEEPERAAGVPCLGTFSRLHVDPVGQMRLCYGYPPLGHILEQDPRRAWRSERARQIREASRECTRPCRMLNCNL
jgi:pyruvate-formate lyase-activating enzyme